MLTRAARRRDALRYAQQAAEQIQLPWLCPAVSRTSFTCNKPRPIARRRATAHSFSSRTVSQTRSLASAAPPRDTFTRDDDFVPFHTSNSRLPYANSQAHDRDLLSHSSLQPLDLKQIIQLDNTTKEAPTEDLKGFKFLESRGTAEEVESTIEVCLKLQRFNRAIILLQHLHNVYKPSSDRLLRMYNLCLQAMVLNLIIFRNGHNVETINSWVEVEMSRAGLEPDARTYALKIKAALSTLSGSRRERTVRRYWELAKKYNFESEVAGLRDILDDHDLGRLTEICPLTLNFELDQGTESEDRIEIIPQLSKSNKPLDEVKEAEQKGLGLSSLRETLAMFSDVESQNMQPRPEESSESFQLRRAQARQSQLEQDAIESAIKRWRAEYEKQIKLGVTNIQRDKVGALCWQWHEMMAKKLKAEYELINKAEATKHKTDADKLRCDYGPLLRLMTPEQAAAFTTLAVFQRMSIEGLQQPIKLASLVVQLGRGFEAEAEAEANRVHRLAKERQCWRGGKGLRLEKDTLVRNTAKNHHSLHRPRFSGGLLFKKYSWTTAQHAKVGAVLCEALFEVAKMDLTAKDAATGKIIHHAQNVFQRITEFENGRRVSKIALSKDMHDLLAREPMADAIAKQLPMVCPPRPWKGFWDGGFIDTDVNFLRIKNGELSQRQYGEAAANRGDLDQLFASIDVLGRTSWKINRDVFEVMLQAWNSGEKVANLAPLDKQFDLPPKPDASAATYDKIKWYQAMQQIENDRCGLHTQRCFQNFQMEIAKTYIDEIFYLPHNIDFRGRAYPIPPYFNQMGADNCRGLMLFANGRELGETGLKWLKVQLSNVFGFDKASLKDREAFPINHWEDILDSVEHPLDGRKWWLLAEDPWQCLAACFELKHALDLPDPTKYVSYLPVQQDGSCNGLQHYAALGGDIAGARQVNLEPGDRPADVYTGVAELVNAQIQQDADGGDPLAKDLCGKIARKIVKQTVMTNVYGVTFLGAIRQVRRQVEDLLPEFKGRAAKASTYIARNIFKALGKMFSGAHDIQYWLGDCANRISTSISASQLELILSREAKRLEKGTPDEKKKTPDLASRFRSSVIWTTPLKLPVVQPYRENKARKVRTNLQDMHLIEPSVADSVSKRKQLQAFPPNFIHSLDATHMALSALKCNEYGLAFSAVHDSFWTHAADIDTMNYLLREAFIRMHSEDIVGRLAAEFQTRYKGNLYLAQVKKHSELGKKITAHRRQIGRQVGKNAIAKEKEQYKELVLEARRQKLLRSEDAMQRDEGANMETPGSIYDQFGGDEYLAHQDSLGETALGNVPETADAKAIQKALEAPDASNGADTALTMETLADDIDNAVPEVEPSNADDGKIDIEPLEVARDTMKKSRKARSKRTSEQLAKETIWLWLPLTFREVPKRVSLVEEDFASENLAANILTGRLGRCEDERFAVLLFVITASALTAFVEIYPPSRNPRLVHIHLSRHHV